MSEVWKPISGYEDIYEVSNLGRVKSLKKRIGGRRKPITVIREHIMTPNDNGNGYLVVSLMKDGKRKNHYVHRLVAEAFCNRGIGSDFVDHKDHNRSNNVASNLEWVTVKENIARSSCLMKHPKLSCKPTSTWEKYITRRVRGKNSYFRVAVKALGIDRTFCDLQSAICFRNEVVKL